MKKDIIVSFPHLGKYHIPISYLIEKLLNKKILKSPPITKKTIEIGSKYSPDFVCVPFKYNLGNYIEALDMGANLLLQAGGGCRYGYYAPLQQKILSDLGYEFQFYTLTNGDSFSIRYLYKVFKGINSDMSIYSFLHYFFITILMINYLDNIDDYIRLNSGFELNKGDFNRLSEKMYKQFLSSNSISKLIYYYIKYRILFKRIKQNKPNNRIKIGIIGELYTSMETFSSCNIEEALISKNVEVKRFTNVSYLLFKKRFKKRMMLKYVKDYISHSIGADGLDNVYRTKKLIDQGYDGIIHIKPFGCTPEVGAISIIDKICKDNNMPIIYFSFDTQTSDEGVKTRIEAFYDMIKLKKEHNND